MWLGPINAINLRLRAGERAEVLIDPTLGLHALKVLHVIQVGRDIPVPTVDGVLCKHPFDDDAAPLFDGLALRICDLIKGVKRHLGHGALTARAQRLDGVNLGLYLRSQGVKARFVIGYLGAQLALGGANGFQIGGVGLWLIHAKPQ